MLTVKGMELGEDKRSITINFDNGESCVLAGLEMQTLSRLYRDIINDFQNGCREGGCGPTNWHPLQIQ